MAIENPQPAGSSTAEPEETPEWRGGAHPVLQAMCHLGIEETERAKLLDGYQSFAQGTQHDHHNLDWSGGRRTPKTTYMLERLQAQRWTTSNTQDVSSLARKPDTAAPLALQIVSRFTEMLLGSGRRPSLLVNSDADTQAYLEAVFSCGGLWESLTQARDIAGSCGSALVACSLRKGRPTSEALNPKYCWVPPDAWSEDGAGRWRPRVVVEQLLVEAEYQDPETGKVKSTRVWSTRAWDENYHYTWPDVPEAKDDDEHFEWPDPVAVPHKLGICPVVWIQNTRDDKSPDGDPDCKGVWELLDKIDRLWSQVAKATMANIDPSLVVKEEDRNRRKAIVLRKGKAMGVSPQGDIKYLEMQGTGVASAMKVIDELETMVLQVTECVVIRQENATVYQSGEALQILWRSMESKANRLRATMETAIRDLCELWLRWGKVLRPGNLDTPAQGGLLLPPRRLDTPTYTVRDDTGQPTGEVSTSAKNETDVATGTQTTWVIHTIGKGRYVAMKWPQYWNPTAVQTQTVMAGLTTATGGKAVLSVESAVRHAAAFVGTTGDEELERMEREAAAAQAKAEAMMTFEDDEDDEDEDDPSSPPGGDGKGGDGKGGDE